MTRIETLRRSTAEAHAQRLAPLAEQMQRLRQMGETIGQQAQSLATAQTRSTEELAQRLMPVAEAMAALTEESRSTLTGIVERSAKIARRSAEDSRAATAAAQQAADQAKTTSAKLEDQLTRLEATIMTMQTQPSPWRPTLITIAVIVAAVAWLAWRAKLL